MTGKLNEVEFRAEANPALHPGQSAAIYLKGERIGTKRRPLSKMRTRFC
ncbi:hypothetical protein ACT4UM_05455 [Bacillus sp. SS-TM]